ncbi:fluoride efflux transporter CrcB [Palleronia sp. LCG004]|uniref:fluoride efflux transporter CrcB n=1 Tax=Palleronia sp. LCG004 TaxID=3079304 RepID=UPI002942B1BD|nr:fluoride efflux transporter CrcB [Palleronia sp. LCG004]WOI56533.1 fluoride efflux transporter CrcB [Palleronia sp. LCG004]
MMSSLLQVVIGGGLGAGLRFLLASAVSRATGPGLPLGVLTANVLGSFLMGVFVVVAAQRGLTYLSPFLAVGLLGGFTTFSSFSLETVTLLERGAMNEAALYVLLSVGASLGGLYLGLVLARGAFA